MIDLKTCGNLPLKIVGEKLHVGQDFMVSCNSDGPTFDFLIFTDSRGIGRQFEGSLADRCMSSIEGLGKTFLLVCRPLNLTIWASLVGFLANNKISVKKIITNMGFVDFTPKKKSIRDAIIRQVTSNVKDGVVKSQFVETYISGNKKISLYTLCYDSSYQLAVERIATEQKLVVINTPLTSPSISIERKRPPSFFDAQTRSNAFNQSITGVEVIDLPEFDETLTYDAVHYTDAGNELIFNKVKEFL